MTIFKRKQHLKEPAVLGRHLTNFCVIYYAEVMDWLKANIAAEDYELVDYEGVPGLIWFSNESDKLLAQVLHNECFHETSATCGPH